MVTYSADHEAAMNKIMGKISGATAAKMFGFPVYKVNGKTAVSLAEEGIVLKVGKPRAKELIGKNNIHEHISKMGVTMGGWVLLKGDFDSHKGLFEEAVKFVQSETK